MTRFQLICHDCKVSFPPDRKRCMYCGGPLGDSSARVLKALSFETVVPSTGRPQPVEALPEEEQAEETEEVRRSPFRVVTSVVWVALAVIASIYRVCTEGG